MSTQDTMSTHRSVASPSACETTSSRLVRQQSDQPELAALESVLTADAIAHCELSFLRSPFFQLLASGTLEPSLMQYAFAQYGHFRLQLHRWFGSCIVKASNAADPAQRSAIMALSDHIFTDLQDNHDGMFQAMLEQLGVGPGKLHGPYPSAATRAYIGSFFHDFAADEHDFFVALAALSGRELSVSLRNRHLLRSYFEPRGLVSPTWLTLHTELEIEHFRDAVRPVITRHGGGSLELHAVTTAITIAIDRHVEYFDTLLLEYGAHLSP